MPGRPETTDLPLVLVAIPLSVAAIKSAGYSSIQPSQQPGGWGRPDKGEKWGVLCAGATFERALFAFLSPTCFTTDRGEAVLKISNVLPPLPHRFVFLSFQRSLIIKSAKYATLMCPLILVGDAGRGPGGFLWLDRIFYVICLHGVLNGR